MEDFNRPDTRYSITTRKASQKRVVFYLLALLATAVFLLVCLLMFGDAQEPGRVQGEATATAFSLTATAFAVKFRATLESGNPDLPLPLVQETSTRFFQDLQTAQPLLFPSGLTPPTVTLTPGTPEP